MRQTLCLRSLCAVFLPDEVDDTGGGGGGGVLDDVADVVVGVVDRVANVSLSESCSPFSEKTLFRYSRYSLQYH